MTVVTKAPAVRYRTRGAWGSVAAVILAVHGGPAWAYDKQACVRASDDAQTLRLNGKLRAARDQLLVCAHASCPAIVRSACTQWMAEVDQSVPTIVPAARKADGTDVPGVRLAIDGEAVADRLDGRALAVDPGTHVLRFTAADGAVLERSIVVREGEKDRAITVSFPESVPALLAPGRPAAAQVPGGDPRPATIAPSSAPAGAYVVAGVSALAFVSLAYFGIKFVGDLDHLKATCGASCTDAQTNPVRLEEHVADASLAVGLVAGGLAAWWFLSARTSAPPPAGGGHAAGDGARSTGLGLSLAPIRGGFLAGITRDF